MKIGKEERTKLVTDMLDIITKIMNIYEKDDVMRILDNLRTWAKNGVTNPFNLLQVAVHYEGNKTPLDTTYDDEVHDNVGTLYGDASVKGSYATKLLEAGLEAKRGCDILGKLANANSEKEFKLDLVPYVKDARWSDRWIEMLDFCTNYLTRASENGYDILRHFTPDHSEDTFYEICYHLRPYLERKVSLDWLDDPYWTPATACNVLALYQDYPDIDWCGDLIRPWTSKFAVNEIIWIDVKSPDACIDVVNRWSNVSPILEHALSVHMEENDYTRAMGRDCYCYYDRLRKEKSCDGDELAISIYSKEYPDGVMRRQKECWEKNRIPKGAVEWLRENGPKSLSKLDDSEVWELCHDRYYEQHNKNKN